MDQLEQVAKLVEMLNLIRFRPSLYMRDIHRIDEFLDGFRGAALTLGLFIKPEIIWETQALFGWMEKTRLTKREIQEAFPNHTMPQIAQLLLEIEVNIWLRNFDLPQDVIENVRPR